MYSNRHLCIIKENLIKHLYHHREQFLCQGLEGVTIKLSHDKLKPRLEIKYNNDR